MEEAPPILTREYLEAPESADEGLVDNCFKSDSISFKTEEVSDDEATSENEPIVVLRYPAASPTEVWKTKGKANTDDYRATEIMLTLRKHYASQFGDRTVMKNRLWAEIGQELRGMGYDVNGKKCQEKFKNLVKSYVGYIKYKAASKGPLLRPPPLHFYSLKSILEADDKYKPSNISKVFDKSDTSLGPCKNTPPPAEGETSVISNLMPSSSTDPLGGGDTCSHPKKRKKLDNNSFGEVREELRVYNGHFEHLRRLMEENNKLFKEQNEILKVQNEQRRQIVSLLQKILGKPEEK